MIQKDGRVSVVVCDDVHVVDGGVGARMQAAQLSVLGADVAEGFVVMTESSSPSPRGRGARKGVRSPRR